MIEQPYRPRLSEVIQYLWPRKYFGLLAQLIHRDWHQRYRESMLGTGWAFVTPLLMLCVYTLVFRGVFKLQWPGQALDSNWGFALHIYAGLAVFNFFSECISRAPRLVIEQPHLVKKVIFPLEILPWVSTLTALIHLGIAWVVLVVAGALATGQFHLTALLAPLIWLPLIPLCLGFGWLLASIGTFVKDVQPLLALMLSLLLFLSPVFFPLTSLPSEVQLWAAWNPLALPISNTRLVMLEGQWPNWASWLLHLGFCCVLAWLGANVFARARRGFADVL